MNKIKIVTLVVLCLTAFSCEEKVKHSFQLEKRFWTVQDYKEAITELKYGYESDEKLPSFNDPETKIIVEKLVDHENYKIVLEDDELGLKHRNEEAQRFFTHWKEMTTIYNSRDLKDNYLYDKEEKAYSEKGKINLAKGIDDYFTELVELYPQANFEKMLRKIELMDVKSKSPEIKASLNKLKKMIMSKQPQESVNANS